MDTCATSIVDVCSGAQLTTAAGRKRAIQTVTPPGTLLHGVNEDGEDVVVGIDSRSGMQITTYQSNGWVRINYYDIDGVDEGETFDGRWKTPGGTRI